jgi:hypothetical protein
VPTYDSDETFNHQYDRLTPAERAAFREALKDFIADCDTGRFRASLRVHKIESLDAYSMTWAGNGRAIFNFGPPRVEGKRHVDWLSIGTHAVYKP